MKRIILLLAVLALLCGCAPKNGDLSQPTDNDGSTSNTNQIEQTEVSVPQTEATEPTEATTEPPETTEPTEPPVSELTVADWQLEEPNYLSYEEYFSVERQFHFDSRESFGYRGWAKGSKRFNLIGTAVVCEEDDAQYYIPVKTSLEGYSVLSADGHFGYYLSENTLLRVDLATGETKTLLKSPGKIHMCNQDNLVLYFIELSYNELALARMYLPTGKVDLLYEMKGQFYKVALKHPESTKSPVCWTMANPDMVDLLERELADPNSQYKKIPVNDGTVEYDYSRYWEAEDGLVQILNNAFLLHRIQDTSGIRAYKKYTYDPVNDSLTRQTGIIDSCSHGSDLGHDHFNPDITTAPAPQVIMGQWQKIAEQIPFPLAPEGTKYREKADGVIMTDVDSSKHLYLKVDGTYKKIIEMPLALILDTGSSIIYVSADNSALYATNYDGSQSVKLYEAAHGKLSDMDIGYENKRLLFRDGDTLVELNLVNGEYRELVSNPYFAYSYVDMLHEKELDKIYFVVTAGLYTEGFLLDLVTGELTGGVPRL